MKAKEGSPQGNVPPHRSSQWYLMTPSFILPLTPTQRKESESFGFTKRSSVESMINCDVIAIAHEIPEIEVISAFLGDYPENPDKKPSSPDEQTTLFEDDAVTIFMKPSK
ncbi:hypothetical protein SBOR_8101 [Sclerotinia borealis F-4128]|uniref:Uncharacterized protein n=1 Tax=Sclerotinia borealis (strain F-4128) TaxID=1432307 RepID=W9CAD8_SCLBF|nr:hypothetical protein SBOR_8101 [Sclerotinia borealis F-4128]